MSTVTVTCPALNLKVRALMGEDPATVTAGYGGWVVASRPRRVGLSVWEGRTPYSMTLPLRFDGWKLDDAVDTELAYLERMALPLEEYKTPPPVTVSPPAPHFGLPWVINGLTWGANIIRADGKRLRQDVTIDLMEYVIDDVLQFAGAAAAARENAKQQSESKLYVVKTGDTLISIAVKMLGNGSRWTEIADLNNIRDGQRLTQGDEIRLPPKLQ
jgi:LysM domain